MYPFSVPDEETLDTIGEVAGGRVGVASVETGDQDALSHLLKHFFQVFAGSVGKYFHAGGVFDGGFHLHLGGDVGIEEIGLHHAFFYDGHLPGGHAFTVKQAAAGVSRRTGAVQDGEPFREYFFAQRILQEGILLLQAVSSQGVQKGSDQFGGTFGVYDEGVFPALHFLRSYLLHGPLISCPGAAFQGQVLQAGRGVPPVRGEMAALGIFYGTFVANLEGGFRMAGIQTLGVYGKAVEDGIRVLAFLGDEVCLRPGRGEKSQLPPPLRRKGLVLRIIKVQLQAADGIFGQPLGGRKVPEGIRIQHLHRLDGGSDEGFQALPIQAVGRKGAVLAVDKKLKLQAPVQGMGRLVHFSVQQADQVHQALG